MAFPPRVTYPLKIDNDKTLYKVYNTTETKLAVNNNAWSDEIEIVPMGADELEIWADNGFGNIEGELFYYDAVAKDTNGKVYKLRRCIRALEGKTKYNNAGTWVRSFVVGEHHNQLAEAIFKIEQMILDLESQIDFQENTMTDCPEIDFQILSQTESPIDGTTIDYNINIRGNFNNFRIEFGDGFSSTLRTGSHTYAPNTNIDPIVIVENNSCSVVITTSGRNVNTEPQSSVPDESFLFPIPDPISFPQLNFNCPAIPETTLTLPTFIPPCITLGSIGPIPSVISIQPPIQVPSRISITPVNIPSIVRITGLSNISIPSTISFLNIPSIPNSISFGNVPSFPTEIEIIGPTTISVINTIPSQIQINGTIPSRISIIGVIPSRISIVGISRISFARAPSVSVFWGTPPTIPISVVCASSTMAFGALGSEWKNISSMDVNNSNPIVEFSPEDIQLGIPTEIKITGPDSLPKEIKINSEGIPNEIKLIGNIPNEINIKHDIPSTISINSNIPKIIEIKGAEKIPQVISVVAPTEFPKIQIDTSSLANIKLIPETITINTNIPSEIVAVIKQPEPLEIVYKGEGIPLRFDPKPFGIDSEELPCFSMIPCPIKK